MGGCAYETRRNYLGGVGTAATLSGLMVDGEGIETIDSRPGPQWGKGNREPQLSEAGGSCT